MADIDILPQISTWLPDESLDKLEWPSRCPGSIGKKTKDGLKRAVTREIKLVDQSWEEDDLSSVRATTLKQIHRLFYYSLAVHFVLVRDSFAAMSRFISRGFLSARRWTINFLRAASMLIERFSSSTFNRDDASTAIRIEAREPTLAKLAQVTTINPRETWVKRVGLLAFE